MSANLKAKKIIALRYEVKGLKAETARRSASSWFRGDSGSSRRLTQREKQIVHCDREKFHTLEIKSSQARFAFCSERFLSKFCEESVLTSALAPFLVL